MVVCALVAALVNAVDLVVSQRTGLLSYPAMYDGIGWLVEARSALDRFVAHPGLDTALAILHTRSALWEVLISLHWLGFGQGVVQAYSARFWPSFLLLLLVHRIASRRGSRWMSWCAVAAVTMTPLVSVSLRSAGAALITDRVGRGWYLADLRPDFLFAVLLAWVVVLLVEEAAVPERGRLAVAFGMAALATITKSNTAPLVAVAVGTAMLWRLAQARRGRCMARLVHQSIGAAAPAALILLVWVVGGGLAATLAFFTDPSQGLNSIYTLAHGGAWSDVQYYSILAADHLGLPETFGIVALMLLEVGRCVRSRRISPAVIIVLIAVVLFAVAAATPNKNYFLGLPAYTLALVAAVTTLSDLVLARRPRIVGPLTAVWVMAAVGVGAAATSTWPSEQSGGRAVAETRALADRLRLLHVHCFSYAAAYGFPDSLRFDLMDQTGQAPSSTAVDVVTPADPDAWVRERAARCDAFLIYDQPVELVAQDVYCPPSRYPYVQAMARWVHDPAHGFTVDSTYAMSFPEAVRAVRDGVDLSLSGPLRSIQPRMLTLRLYIRSG